MAMSKRPSAKPCIWKAELGVGVTTTRRSFCSKKPCRSAAQMGRFQPPGKTMTFSVFNSGGGLDVQLLQLAHFRAVVHREAVAEVEQVLVLEARVVLDLPPVMVEV